MKKILSLITILSASFSLIAQEYPVGYGEIIDCGAFLVDNGMSAGDYGPNENSTSTICPDGTDDPIINLYFSFMNLGTGDSLWVYDGSTVDAPLLGAFGASDAQGLDVTATNVDGCLTVVFISNSDGEVGSFGAEISCGEPCEKPWAVVTSDETQFNPVKVCVGEEITFDGSSSELAEGVSLAAFTWDFDDETTDNTNWPSVTHSFDEPGAYLVQLTLTDDNECTSLNHPDYLVYVSTTPSMETAASDYMVCVGQTVEVTAEFEPTFWIDQPEANFGDGLFIPDDQTQCFSADLTFSTFAAGSTIDEISDLDFFFINFEHSYMGDISITFLCPDGQSIVVHEPGGGGTFLGEPIDDEGLNPGIGYDYFWSPDATNGTWVENGFGGTLPSGTYESVQSFDNLLGCPLNGTWTVEVCDMFAADNGFIFDWGVQFAPELYPELLSFTPSIGLGCDSSYWSGNLLTNIDEGCDNFSFVPTEEGTFTYTYTLEDDFGCVFSEQIVIESYPGPTALVSDDMPFCMEEIELEAIVGNEQQGIQYIYNWTPNALLQGSNTLNPTIPILLEDTEFVFSVYPVDDPQCIITDTVLVFIPQAPQAEPLDSLEFCAGDDALLVAPFQQSGYTYGWFYSEDGFEDYENVGFNPSFSAAETGHYFVQITEPICGFTSETPFYLDVISCEVIFPNVFTPNGDSQDFNNALVFPGLENFEKSTLLVYNRWGNLIYESNNYNNNWTPSEEDVPEGTYFYILGINKSGGFEYHEGHLTLLRKER
jgi:gliding motility-associated-like protein